MARISLTRDARTCCMDLPSSMPLFPVVCLQTWFAFFSPLLSLRCKHVWLISSSRGLGILCRCRLFVCRSCPSLCLVALVLGPRCIRKRVGLPLTPRIVIRSVGIQRVEYRSAVHAPRHAARRYFLRCSWLVVDFTVSPPPCGRARSAGSIRETQVKSDIQRRVVRAVPRTSATIAHAAAGARGG